MDCTILGEKNSNTNIKINLYMLQLYLCVIHLNKLLQAGLQNMEEISEEKQLCQEISVENHRKVIRNYKHLIKMGLEWNQRVICSLLI